MSDEEKRWPFDGFYLKLAEAQREYEQEQHIDPASLTEEERQQKLQEIEIGEKDLKIQRILQVLKKMTINLSH